jgi:hypothetical protein
MPELVGVYAATLSGPGSRRSREFGTRCGMYLWVRRNRRHSLPLEWKKKTVGAKTGNGTFTPVFMAGDFVSGNKVDQGVALLHELGIELHLWRWYDEHCYRRQISSQWRWFSMVNTDEVRSEMLSWKIVLLVQIWTGWQAKPSDDSAPMTAGVCDLLSNPAKYDGKLVKVSGRWDGTDEGSWLEGNACKVAFVAESQTWPSAISLESPESTSRVHAVDFREDHKSMTQLERSYLELRKTVAPACIATTILGVFETRQDWLDPNQRNAQRPHRNLGFGHLNSCPGQLLVKSGESVSVVPGCQK